MLKDTHLHTAASVPEICGRLDGRIFEARIPDEVFAEFEKNHLMLSNRHNRQEQGFVLVRLYMENPESLHGGDIGQIPCNPSLEDVFLVTYT